jgi:hypothetical protein
MPQSHASPGFQISGPVAGRARLIRQRFLNYRQADGFLRKKIKMPKYV